MACRPFCFLRAAYPQLCPQILCLSLLCKQSHYSLVSLPSVYCVYTFRVYISWGPSTQIGKDIPIFIFVNLLLKCNSLMISKTSHSRISRLRNTYRLVTKINVIFTSQYSQSCLKILSKPQTYSYQTTTVNFYFYKSASLRYSQHKESQILVYNSLPFDKYIQLYNELYNAMICVWQLLDPSVFWALNLIVKKHIYYHIIHLVFKIFCDDFNLLDFICNPMYFMLNT